MTDSTATLFLTKLLPVFVYPLSLAIGLLLLAGLLAARPRAAMLCRVAAIMGLWTASTAPVAEWALGTLEQQYPPRPIAELPQADVAILLGGAVGGAIPPRATSELTASGDRVLHAARLFRSGKVARILVTGGNLPWHPGSVPEAALIRDLLIEWGVPAAAIEIADESRNTYENAIEVRTMRERQPFASALLVTSAAHMPRAIATFRKAGIPATAATTDVEVTDAGPWTPLRWLPDAGALDTTTQAIKEWIGFAAYRARGYL